MLDNLDMSIDKIGGKNIDGTLWLAGEYPSDYTVQKVAGKVLNDIADW
jgi:hypothetical protein